jgi:crossover junction endodeoxyribonuclease RuvC
MTTTNPLTRVVGLDLSLTSTGIALIANSGARLHRIQPGNLTGHERMQRILTDTRIWTEGCELIVIEGPSFGSPGRQHEMGGLWWLITRALWRRSRPYAVVEPSKLKRYATGKGNASKDEVLSAVVRRYPMADVNGNDVADALVLAAMGADHLGIPLAPVPQAHRAALTGIRWPDTT